MRRSSSILAVILFALPLFAQTPAPFPEPWPKALVPEAYWQTLVNGNATYMAGALPYKGLQGQRDANVGGQNPPVTVLSCADSRVPAELIFGRAIGDLFVVRVAGNVASTLDIASIEYAIAHKWTLLIVVMGHEDCGAVKAALEIDDPPTPSLVTLVQRIRESFLLSTWTGPDNVERAIKANARSSAAYLLAHSTVIRKAVLEHRVGLIAAYYNLKSGKVEEVKQ
ncbi:MAG: carbonic anhydrase [Thermoanaerobaculia bacterium]|jgi:carbonic anhydrase|nr:carbonic anhydrase [Thermoanaerobaculia bacterium]